MEVPLECQWLQSASAVAAQGSEGAHVEHSTGRRTYARAGRHRPPSLLSPGTDCGTGRAQEASAPRRQHLGEQETALTRASGHFAPSRAPDIPIRLPPAVGVKMGSGVTDGTQDRKLTRLRKDWMIWKR